jgi:hypothetical protein
VIDLRSERRFSCTPDQLGRLLADTHDHVAPVTYDALRPFAYTRTIYFAARSPGVSDLRFRVREYFAAATETADPEPTGLIYLELKASAGDLRRKLRRRVRDPASGARRLRALGLEPELVVWYRRHAFHGIVDRVRLTFDDEIGFAAWRAGEPTRWIPGPRSVVEVKWSDPMPRWLARALARLSAATSPSKSLLARTALRRDHEADEGAMPSRSHAALMASPGAL